MDTWLLMGDIQHRIEELISSLRNPLIQEPKTMRNCVESHLRGISQVIDEFRVASSQENAERVKD
jgi:hypothetical protein